MIDNPLIHDLFQAPARLRSWGGAYLASNTMGLIPLSAIKAEQEALVQLAAKGIGVWDEGDWMAVLDRYARVIARYMEVRPEQVCPITNITDGLWRIFSAFDYSGDRRTILQTGLEFTTQEYAAFAMRAFGATIEVLDPGQDRRGLRAEVIADAVKRYRPLVLNLSHAAFESAWLHDVRPIAQACKEAGTFFCLDAAQTGFIRPFTLASTGADAIVLQQHKWGCAGTGAACLVLTSDALKRLEPALVGWMSHADPFRFERGPARLAESAWRFVGGTPDVPSKARGALSAELIVDILGIENVAEHNRTLLARLIEGLDAIGLPAIDVPERTGFVAVPCPSPEDAKRITLALHTRSIIIDHRHDRLRIGPTFYNTLEDIENFLKALKEVQSNT